jgi:quinol-cytochrome oxidoreductase complex cytochrome b subunit
VRTGTIPLTLWGLGLLLVALLGVVAFDLHGLPAALLFAAGAAAVLTGAASALDARRHARARGEPAPGVEVVPRSSLATVAMAFGATVALVGAIVGQAVLWPGVGILVLGAAGVAREQRAAHRLLQRGRRG